MISKFSIQLLNIRMLLRIVGWLLCIEGAFMLAPLATCLVYGESDWLPFAGATTLTLISGILLARYSKPTQTHFGKRDGFLLTASVWLFFSFFGLIPFLFCSQPLSFTDAFFEAMSGFTTTGSSSRPDFNGMSHGVHIWRAMMQWIGGMGIILFTLAVIPMLNHSGGIQMFNAEVTGITHDKIRPRISQTAKSLWLVYIILTASLVLLLWAGPMNFFESLCHALGTVSTGGYSTEEVGVNAWQNSVYIKSILIIFMFLGGVNFALIFKTAKGDFNAMRQNSVFRTYVSIISVMFVALSTIILLSEQTKSWMDYTIDPLFQIVSSITSTGFTTNSLASWNSLTLVLICALMFMGGCAGSTSGGAKIDRFIYLFKHIRNELYRCIHPNAILSVRVNDKVVNPDLVSKVMAFLFIYILLIFAGSFVLAACGVPMADAFFSACSCISNTGYGENFIFLPDLAKWVLCLLMLIGRLELFTVLVLFTPAFWRH